MIIMRRDIEKIIERYKLSDLTINKAVNEILLLSIVKKDDIEICPICEKHLLINGTCPRCTIDLCTPLEQIDL